MLPHTGAVQTVQACFGSRESRVLPAARALFVTPLCGFMREGCCGSCFCACSLTLLLCRRSSQVASLLRLPREQGPTCSKSFVCHPPLWLSCIAYVKAAAEAASVPFMENTTPCAMVRAS